MIDLIKLLEKMKFGYPHRGKLHGIYNYLDMIGSPTNLTSSIYISHTFGNQYSNKNDTSSIQIVIPDLHVRQKIIFERCGRIGHKTNS